MKRYLTGTLLFLLALGLTTPVFARASLYDHERSQHRRIQQGINSGELTRKEVRILRKEQQDIRQLKRRFLRDGRVSKRERRVLQKQYVRAGQHIYRFKHNNRTRYTNRHGPYSPWSSGGREVAGFIFGHRF